MKNRYGTLNSTVAQISISEFRNYKCNYQLMINFMYQKFRIQFYTHSCSSFFIELNNSEIVQYNDSLLVNIHVIIISHNFVIEKKKINQITKKDTFEKHKSKNSLDHLKMNIKMIGWIILYNIDHI